MNIDKTIEQAEKLISYYNFHSRERNFKDAPCNMTYLKYQVQRVSEYMRIVEREREKFLNGENINRWVEILERITKEIIEHAKPEIYQVLDLTENCEQYKKDLKSNKSNVGNFEYWEKGRSGHVHYNDDEYILKEKTKIFKAEVPKVREKIKEILHYYQGGFNDAPCNMTYLKSVVLERTPKNFGVLDLQKVKNDLLEIVKYAKPEIYQVKKIRKNSKQYQKDLKGCKGTVWEKGRFGYETNNDKDFYNAGGYK